MPALYEAQRKALGEAEEHEGVPALQSNGGWGDISAITVPVSPPSQGLGDNS